jgi:hypothetical protein
VRPIERIGGPLDPVQRVPPTPRGERADRRAESDPRRDERRRKQRPRPARPMPAPDTGEGHVDVVA